MTDKLLYPKESYQIVSALLEVHKQLGCGFLEKVYQEALEVEFCLRNIPFEREKKMQVWYKGNQLSTFYIADFVCYDKIVVELKSVDELLGVHVSQVINYLKISNYQLGLLVNFGEEFLQPRRIVLSYK